MIYRICTGLAALAFMSAPASAATVFDDLNDEATILFEGFSDDYLGQATPVPGLTGSLTLKLTSFSGNYALFSYSLLNTSTAPMTSARITFFGFDVEGDGGFNAALTDATDNLANGNPLKPTGIFNMVDSGNIPMNYPDVGICFGSGNGNNCSGGGGNPGAEIGAPAATGTFALAFNNSPGDITLNNFYIRYQSLTNAQAGLQGDSGVGREVVPNVPVIPEPATWALMIAGFGLVGSVMRRRRGVASVHA